MSIHVIMGQAREIKKEQKEEQKNKEAQVKAQQAMFKAAGAMTLERKYGDEEMGEANTDNKAKVPPILDEIDLTCVNWSSSAMQALFIDDTSI